MADTVQVPLGLQNGISDYQFCVILDAEKNIAKEKNPGNNAAISADKLVVSGAKGGCFEDAADKGGANKVGPNLWNIVDRKKASHEGFSYSSGLQAKGGDWTYEDINHMIFKPQGYVRGTKMAFAGLVKEQDRADVIAYLRTMSDSPAPLP